VRDIHVGKRDTIAAGPCLVPVVGIRIGCEKSGPFARLEVAEEDAVRQAEVASPAQRLSGDLLDGQVQELEDAQYESAAGSIDIADRDGMGLAQSGQLRDNEVDFLVDPVRSLRIGPQPGEQRSIDQCDDGGGKVAAQGFTFLLGQSRKRFDLATAAHQADVFVADELAFVVVDIIVFEMNLGCTVGGGRKT